MTLANAVLNVDYLLVVYPTSVLKAEDLEVELEKASHYMLFAAAAYGWPLYIYSNLFTGPCKLCGDWWDANSAARPGF